MRSSAKVGDGKNILPGDGSRAVLHALRQRAHRQKRQEHLRPPAVSLSGLRRLSDPASQKPPSDTLLSAEKGDVLELDKLWSFVGSKANVRWVWIALCRQTRQIVACFVGDRSAESARALRERIPADYRCRATRSDFWLSYEHAFPRRTHRMCGKDEGQTNHDECFFCTLRQRLGRFVRKTLSFSKCEPMHEVALRLFIHQYNRQPII